MILRVVLLPLSLGVYTDAFHSGNGLSRPLPVAKPSPVFLGSGTIFPYKSKRIRFDDLGSVAVPLEEANSSEKEDEDKLFESFGKGIARDYKARIPFYLSDIKDGLNVQCLAVTLFLFFACLSPAVGFGALYGVATDGAIGTGEFLLMREDSVNLRYQRPTFDHFL